MKKLKKFVSFVLCITIISCALLVTPSYASYTYNGWEVDYPLCKDFLEIFYAFPFDTWYKVEYLPYSREFTSLRYLSCLWLEYYDFDDNEKICEEYLGEFDSLLDNAQTDTQRYNYRVDSYSWDGNTLTVQCSADYKIAYYCTYEYGEYYVDISGNNHGKIYLALENKSDGSLVYVGNVHKAELAPEYKYGYEGNRYTDPEYPMTPELDAIANKDEGIRYTCVSTTSFTVDMPYFYDPQTHEAVLYFYSYDTEMPFFHVFNYTSESFYNPAPLTRDDIPEPEVVRGDADGDGVLNLADVTATMKYLAEWENITIDETAADTNGSGDVNLTDVSLMLQLIAGWNV